MAQLYKLLKPLLIMGGKFISPHNAHGVIPFLMNLNKTHSVFRKLFYQVIIVFRRFYGHFIRVLAEVIYNLTRNVVVNMHFLKAAFNG